MTTYSPWPQLLNDLALEPAPTDSNNPLKIYPLDYQAVLQISGPDSQLFLQGQLTCDMREVHREGSRIAAHCNPKGSMLSTMRVIAHQDDFLLRINTQNFTDSHTALNKYMMFSKAQATDLSEQWVGFGITGEQAVSFLRETFEKIPECDNHTHSQPNKVLTKVPGDRYEAWMSLQEARQWLTLPTLQTSLLTSNHWKTLDIINAIADVYPLSSGHYIPQMANLQALAGISFQKGCYTGQEIITRLHFRGKLNKQLITGKFSLNSPEERPEIGQKILNFEKKSIGKVLQSSIANGMCYLQIIINHKDAEQSLFLEAGTELQNITLPYSLDPDLFIRKA